MTHKNQSVTEQRDTSPTKSVTPSRAQDTPSGWVSRCHAVTVTHRDVTLNRDSDVPLRSTSRQGQTDQGKGNWTHIAAMNLIADHEAGIAVSPMKLEAARKLLAA